MLCLRTFFVRTAQSDNDEIVSSQDVKLTASNDDYYFVFEDFLYQVGVSDRLGPLTEPWTQQDIFVFKP